MEYADFQNYSSNDTEMASTARPDDDSSSFLDSRIQYMLYIILSPIICFIGIIGNVISLCVFRRQRRSSSAQFLLQALAVSDLAFLASVQLLAFPLHVIRLGGYTDNTKRNIYAVLVQFMFPAINMLELGTIFMIVIITIDR
jgi:hypothetical protein